MAVQHGAEPFYLPGGRHGVLLVHGFTGSPAEMRQLGEALHAAGFTVHAVRLTGHGTTPDDMARTRWPHWFSDVEDGYLLLKSLTDRVSVVGLSMGALLGFRLAVEYPVERLVSLSAPVFINEPRLPLLPLFRIFRQFMPKPRKRLQELDNRFVIAYDEVPLAALKSLLDLIEETARLLPRILAPVLLVQSRAEHTVKPESAQYLYDRLGSADKKLVWLEKSGHIVTVDGERDEVFRLTEAFLRQ